MYRNPEEIRAFSIVLVCLQPFLYGPYYVYVAQSTSVGFAVLFALFCGFITVRIIGQSQLVTAFSTAAASLGEQPEQ